MIEVIKTIGIIILWILMSLIFCLLALFSWCACVISSRCDNGEHEEENDK